MKTNDINFATGIIVAILAVVVMGAALAPDAIWNSVFDSTNSAIKIISVQDTFSNNVAVGGTLTVTGATALEGGLTMDTSAFTVANTSGNTGIAGTLTVTGATALNGGLAMDSTAFTVANTSGNVATAGTLDVTGATALAGGVIANEGSADVDFRVESDNVTDALLVDASKDVVSLGAWNALDYVKTTDQSYSLSSTGRAGNFIQTVGGAASFHLMTALLTSPGAGAMITVKTGGSNDVVIDTEGSETIDGAATYTLDGSYEAVTLTNDGSNWFILGGYLE